MSSMVALDGSGAAFHPFLTRPGISLKARFVAKENFAGRVGKEINQFCGEVFALDLPRFTVGRFGHAAGNFPGIAVLVEITVEGAICQIELLLFAEVAAEFGKSPVGLSSEGGEIIYQREDQLRDDVGLKLPAPAASRAVNKSVDAQLVET